MAAAAREPLRTQESLELQERAGAAPHAGQAVYGMHFGDAVVGALAKKVIHLSLVLMGIVILNVVLLLASTGSVTAMARETFEKTCEDSSDYDDDCQSLVDAEMALVQGTFYALIVLTCLFGFCIPCCGYLGAKKNDKNLMCCFFGCNVLSVLQGVAAVIQFVSQIGGQPLVLVSLVIAIVLIGIHAAAAFFGWKLYDHLSQGRVITMAPPYPAMVATQVQPQVAYPAATAQVLS